MDTTRIYLPEHNLSVRGILEQYVKSTVLPEDWDEVRERAWSLAVSETWNQQEDENQPGAET